MGRHWFPYTCSSHHRGSQASPVAFPHAASQRPLALSWCGGGFAAIRPVGDERSMEDYGGLGYILCAEIKVDFETLQSCRRGGKSRACNDTCYTLHMFLFNFVLKKNRDIASKQNPDKTKPEVRITLPKPDFGEVVIGVWCTGSDQNHNAAGSLVNWSSLISSKSRLVKFCNLPRYRNSHDIFLISAWGMLWWNDPYVTCLYLHSGLFSYVTVCSSIISPNIVTINCVFLKRAFPEVNQATRCCFGCMASGDHPLFSHGGHPWIIHLAAPRGGEVSVDLQGLS